MFVCKPENPILTEVVADVNIMYIQVCKTHILTENKSIIVLLLYTLIKL